MNLKTLWSPCLIKNILPFYEENLNLLSALEYILFILLFGTTYPHFFIYSLENHMAWLKVLREMQRV